jgi:hypothetical protein
MPNWTEEDYGAALKAQEENPHPEFAKAIASYERVHRLGAAEEAGATGGFITQQFPTMGQPIPETSGPQRTAGGAMLRTNRRPDPTGLEGDALSQELRKLDPELPSASKRKAMRGLKRTTRTWFA